jgi:hypothetical protein
VTTRSGVIIDKFKKTFEAYWQNSEFELYDKKYSFCKISKAALKGKSKEYFTTSFILI